MQYDQQMPLDPFADDPNDPGKLFDDLDEDDESLHLTDTERAELVEDLHRVHTCRELLKPLGINGIVYTCDDCNELHFHNWDLMEDDLRAMLDGCTMPIHEPSAKHDTDSYRTWDYCLGFLDGLRTSTLMPYDLLHRWAHQPHGEKPRDGH